MTPRFHALLVVRDEADVICQSVTAALRWADAIYTYDTGSTDGTWELLQQMSRTDPRVVLYRRESVWFRNDLRALLFNEYRSRATGGDWFATLDADEFYHVPPPQFVEEHLRTCETAVCYQLYDFKLTQQEASALGTLADITCERTKPIHLRRRHYAALTYTEPRLFRYRPTMQWVPPKAPFNLGYISKDRIPIRHYSSRDPVQMETKYRIRMRMRPHVGYSASPHWQVTDWRTLLVDESDAAIEYWKPGSDLRSVCLTNHLAPLPKRVLQRIVHFGALPLFDRFRPPFPVDFKPEAIPPETDEELRAS
jgi:hypothetical protein